MRVLVVGGGPVGLLTALHIREAFPDVVVEVRERRLAYARTHTVHVDARSVAHLARSPPFSQLLATFAGRDISIAEIEQRSAALAEHRGIPVHRGAPVGRGELPALARKYDAIIIAAGHRADLVPDGGGERGAPRYLLQLKFAQQREYRPWRVTVAARNWARYGRYTTPVFGDSESAQVFVPLSRGEAETMSAATFRAPMDAAGIRAADARLGELAAAVLADNEGVPHSLRAVRISTAAYRRDRFASSVHGTPVLHVGDAAGGVPYRRSLSASLLTVPAVSAFLRDRDAAAFEAASATVWDAELAAAELRGSYVATADALHRDGDVLLMILIVVGALILIALLFAIRRWHARLPPRTYSPQRLRSEVRQRRWA